MSKTAMLTWIKFESLMRHHDRLLEFRYLHLLTVGLLYVWRRWSAKKRLLQRDENLLITIFQHRLKLFAIARNSIFLGITTNYRAISAIQIHVSYNFRRFEPKLPKYEAISRYKKCVNSTVDKCITRTQHLAYHFTLSIQMFGPMY